MGASCAENWAWQVEVFLSGTSGEYCLQSRVSQLKYDEFKHKAEPRQAAPGPGLTWAFAHLGLGLLGRWAYGPTCQWIAPGALGPEWALAHLALGPAGCMGPGPCPGRGSGEQKNPMT